MTAFADAAQAWPRVGSRIAVIGCCGAGKSRLAVSRLDGSQQVITLKSPRDAERFVFSLGRTNARE